MTFILWIKELMSISLINDTLIPINFHQIWNENTKLWQKMFTFGFVLFPATCNGKSRDTPNNNKNSKTKIIYLQKKRERKDY